MEQISKSQLAVYAALALAVVLVGYRYLHREDSQGSGQTVGKRSAVRVKQSSGGGGSKVTVHVAGAVANPGVYKLAGAARVKSAVEAAGGPIKTADLNAINLAAKLEDGRQVVVPVKATVAAVGTGGGEEDGSGTAVGQSSSASVDTVGGGSIAGAPINLNTATVEQLDQLEGVGETTAQKIVEYRQQNGGFGSINDLDKIPGIGAKRIQTLRTQATV